MSVPTRTAKMFRQLSRGGDICVILHYSQHESRRTKSRPHERKKKMERDGKKLKARPKGSRLAKPSSTGSGSLSDSSDEDDDGSEKKGREKSQNLGTPFDDHGEPLDCSGALSSSALSEGGGSFGGVDGHLLSNAGFDDLAAEAGMDAAELENALLADASMDSFGDESDSAGLDSAQGAESPGKVALTEGEAAAALATFAEGEGETSPISRAPSTDVDGAGEPVSGQPVDGIVASPANGEDVALLEVAEAADDAASGAANDDEAEPLSQQSAAGIHEPASGGSS